MKIPRSGLIGIGIGVAVDLLITLLIPGKAVMETIVGFVMGFIAAVSFMRRVRTTGIPVAAM